MKRMLGLAIPLAVIPAVVHAQANVTLYGSIDNGLSFANNVQGGQSWSMASGVQAGSRWGLKGSEDLGGGLSAIFKLESGFDANTGALSGGFAFSRNAYVGISSDQWGSIKLGRQWDSVVDYVEQFSLNYWVGGYYFAHPNDMDNMDNGFSIPNAVKFSSVNYGGLQFGGLYSFGGQAGQFSTNAIYSAGASYAHGPFSAGVGYLRVNNPENAVYGYQSGGGFVNSVYGDYLEAARSQQVFAIGAAYQITSALAVLGNFTNTTFQNGSSPVDGKNVTFQNYELAVRYDVTPALNIAGGYTYTTGRNHETNEVPKYNQFNVIANYMLSKRTGLYAMMVYQKASGQQEGEPVVAQIAGFNPSSSSKQLVGRVGIQHSF